MKKSTSTRSEKVLRPIRANLGIEASYRKRLNKLIEDLHKSTLYWVQAAYRKNPPALAQDESAADTLRRVMRDLKKRWFKAFDEAAVKLAEYFATQASQRSDAALKKILKDGGIAIEFEMTPAMRDVFKSTVEQNVALIKSIPEQYLGRVEQIVQQSVQSGRDIGYLAKELEKQFGVTKRRAAFISRDQNNKATGALNRARYLEIGIEEAIWLHSGGGREPRPTHLKAGREQARFNVAEGWYDPHEGRHITPGELINCKCSCRPVLKLPGK